jgi:hypothetical protein
MAGMAIAGKPKGPRQNEAKPIMSRAAAGPEEHCGTGISIISAPVALSGHARVIITAQSGACAALSGHLAAGRGHDLLCLGAPFAGALEVIVYAGAIMVLFVFVVMMLNLGPSPVRRSAMAQPGSGSGRASARAAAGWIG